MPKLDPLSLKLFVSVIESSSITAAASMHHIAATAVSKRISDLEHLFGTTLLQRTNRGVHPTDAGKALVSLARRALNEFDSIQIAMQDYCDGGVGLVTLCASTSAMSQFLSRDIADFLVQSPGIKVSVDEQPSELAVRMVADNAVQIGVYANVAETHGLNTQLYSEDHLVLVCHPSHPLAMRDRVSFQDTLVYDYVGWYSGSAINKQLDTAARMSHCNWQVRARVNSFDALAQMVAAQIGIGILPEDVARQRVLAYPLKICYLSDAWAIRQFHLAIRADQALPDPALRLHNYLLRAHNNSKPNDPVPDMLMSMH
ncbi:MAG: LysR family transcriptional regulator [Burkholderiaceae bacterium]|nr:LysR family transcriptional regulator [Burkholderiaceae bacterium]MCD8517187.1 LysR family transcriptional regulator [Burkholderiaceae bacterium]